MMKDYRTEISSGCANNVVNYFIENGFNVECREGALLDNYCIEVGENKLKIGKVKVRNYLIIVEKYLNEWSSSLEMILTDNKETYDRYYKEITA